MLYDVIWYTKYDGMMHTKLPLQVDPLKPLNPVNPPVASSTQSAPSRTAAHVSLDWSIEQTAWLAGNSSENDRLIGHHQSKWWFFLCQVNFNNKMVAGSLGVPMENLNYFIQVGEDGKQT